MVIRYPADDGGLWNLNVVRKCVYIYIRIYMVLWRFNYLCFVERMLMVMLFFFLSFFFLDRSSTRVILYICTG